MLSHGRERGRVVSSGSSEELTGKTTFRWAIWIFPIAGLVSLFWFLLRVIPKPSRATYPCQRVAAPLAGGFVLWIAGVVGSVFAFRRAKELLRSSFLFRSAVCFIIAAVAGIIAIVNIPEDPVIAEDAVSNVPLGTAKGIYPGRVVWTYDSEATDWEGTNLDGEDIGDGYWWQSNHTNQDVVDLMMSRSVRVLAGEPADETAWEAIFRYFNQTAGKGDIDYKAGEKITIKVNMTTVNHVHNNVDDEGNQTKWLGWINTSPQMIVALLRQLVYVVGAEQTDITVGDTTAYFPNHYWDYCHDEFPNVHYLACSGAWNRRGAVSSQGQSCEAPAYWSIPDSNGKIGDYLPVSYAEADYLINFACFKGHSSGITLCAKNHYGSFIRLPSDAGYYNLHFSLPNAGWSPGMAHYRAHVDIMGHSGLGGRTLLFLIDGLYGGYKWRGRPYKWNMRPFCSDWPSSLFASLDPVAIDSVAYDFLLEEWPNIVAEAGLQGGAEDYLHEAALADNPPSGTFYDPDRNGTALTSLGVHEHWNNPVDKLYSRDLGIGDGIELRKVFIGDLDLDADVDLFDFALFARHWAKDCNDTNFCLQTGLRRTAIVDWEDLELHFHNWLRGK